MPNYMIQQTHTEITYSDFPLSFSHSKLEGMGGMT